MVGLRDGMVDMVDLKSISSEYGFESRRGQ